MPTPLPRSVESWNNVNHLRWFLGTHYKGLFIHTLWYLILLSITYISVLNFGSMDHTWGFKRHLNILNLTENSVYIYINNKWRLRRTEVKWLPRTPVSGRERTWPGGPAPGSWLSVLCFYEFLTLPLAGSVWYMLGTRDKIQLIWKKKVVGFFCLFVCFCFAH